MINKVIKPTRGLHDGSSFREMLDIWREKGICEVVDNTTEYERWGDETQWLESRPYANNVGDILLYDQPILDKFNPTLKWNLALFANEVPENNTNNKFFKNWNDNGWCASWTFWPNHPRQHEQVRAEGIPSYDERVNESCFIGSLTTGYRHNYSEWGKYIQHFWMGNSNDRLMTQIEYLNFIKSNKFGLCLRGVGPKCLRDVELIGMGTVPIFTPGVSTNYWNKLEEGKHYLYAEKPEDIPNLIKNCTKEKWEYMSGECLKWYSENCTPEGVYSVTCKIINEFNESEN